MRTEKKLRVLLIGGTGITSTDVSILASKSSNIDLYLLNRGKSPSFFSNRINTIHVNIKHPKSVVLRKLGNLKFDVICDFISFKREDLLNKLDIFKGRYEQYIFISSCSVYRENYSVPQLKNELNTPRGNIQWSYGWDKFLCEETLKQYAKENDIAYTIIRPSVTCDNRYLLNGWTLNGFNSWTFADRLLQGKPLIMPDGGEQQCSVLHAEDFAIALLGIFGNKDAYNEDFNITGSEYISYKDIARIQADSLVVTPVFVDIPTEDIYFFKPELLGNGLLGKIMSKSFNTHYDSSKIRNIVPEFRQSISVQQMTERALAFYKQYPEHKNVQVEFSRMFDEIANRYPSISVNLSYNYWSYYRKYLRSTFDNRLKRLVSRITR